MGCLGCEKPLPDEYRPGPGRSRRWCDECLLTLTQSQRYGYSESTRIKDQNKSRPRTDVIRAKERAKYRRQLQQRGKAPRIDRKVERVEGGFVLECMGCHQMLPEGRFRRQPGVSHGRHSRCNECRHPQDKAHFARRRKARVPKAKLPTRLELWSRQHGLCPLCNLPLPQPPAHGLHLDHIIPIVAGGLHIDANLQLTHGLCNLRKGAKLPGR